MRTKKDMHTLCFAVLGPVLLVAGCAASGARRPPEYFDQTIRIPTGADWKKAARTALGRFMPEVKEQASAITGRLVLFPGVHKNRRLPSGRYAAQVQRVRIAPRGAELHVHLDWMMEPVVPDPLTVDRHREFDSHFAEISAPLIAEAIRAAWKESP